MQDSFEFGSIVTPPELGFELISRLGDDYPIIMGFDGGGESLRIFIRIGWYKSIHLMDYGLRGCTSWLPHRDSHYSVIIQA